MSTPDRFTKGGGKDRYVHVRDTMYWFRQV